MEIVSPHGGQWIWTRKFAPVAVSGTIDGSAFAADGLVDESAGYHARRTSWQWSAGVGRGEGGERVAWNLVTGVHDGKPSENTVWVDGEERETGRVAFHHGLEGVGDLRMSAWASRDENSNLLIFRNSYRQPFGVFEGTLPGRPRLAEGYGVMERHDVRW